MYVVAVSTTESQPEKRSAISWDASLAGWPAPGGWHPGASGKELSDIIKIR